MDEIRVALIDHQPLVRGGLELLLREASGGSTAVVAVTGDAAEAGAVVRRSRPDLVLVELSLPRPGAVHAITAVRRAAPRARTVAMAAGDEPGPLLAALNAGADGLLPHSSEATAMMQPLLAVLAGWAVVPPALLSAMLGAHGRRPAPVVLDEAERTLIRLIAAGATNTEIGLHLHVSERTVKRLTATLLRRLRVSTRTEAAALAGRTGIL